MLAGRGEAPRRNTGAIMVVKAEIHCHIEGAASTALVAAQATKYGVDIAGLIDGDIESDEEA